MKQCFIVTVLCICLVIQSQAQTAEDSVKATIDQLFRAIKGSDGNLLLQCFSDSAVLQTIARNKEGGTLIRSEKITEFARTISTMPKDAADERIVYDVVKIDGPLASVWTPYRFYFNGVFSHCGVNSFQLVRFNGVWKIQYLIDTRRKEPCE